MAVEEVAGGRHDFVATACRSDRSSRPVAVGVLRRRPGAWPSRRCRGPKRCPSPRRRAPVAEGLGLLGVGAVDDVEAVTPVGRSRRRLRRPSRRRTRAGCRLRSSGTSFEVQQVAFVDREAGRCRSDSPSRPSRRRCRLIAAGLQSSFAASRDRPGSIRTSSSQSTSRRCSARRAAAVAAAVAALVAAARSSQPQPARRLAAAVGLFGIVVGFFVGSRLLRRTASSSALRRRRGSAGDVVVEVGGAVPVSSAVRPSALVGGQQARCQRGANCEQTLHVLVLRYGITG